MALISADEKFPFDVLGFIFSHYSEHETIDHPLETLLLVCRTWNQAAMGHLSLWSRFRIYLGHDPISNIWKRRIPSRLNKCGDNVLLDIDLRNYIGRCGAHVAQIPKRDNKGTKSSLSSQFTSILSQAHESDPDPEEEGRCACEDSIVECLSFALKVLAGENGERCAQWSSLYVDFGPTFIRRTDTCVTPQLGIALSFPTPNLLSLTLKYVDGVKYFSKYNQFPNTNKLKSFTLFEAFLPTFPRSAALQKTSLRWCTPYKMNQSSLTMQTATSLRALCLQTYDYNFPFPNQLEALQLLEIHGFILPTALTNCHMPMVTSLYLGCHDCGLPKNILNLCGLDFTRLEELTLTYRKGPLTGSFDDPLEPLWFINNTRELLTKACHLQHLKANRSTMSLVLWMLWTFLQPIPKEQGAPDKPLFRGSLTNIDSNDTVEFVDELGTQFLEKLAAEWGCRDPSQDL